MKKVKRLLQRKNLIHNKKEKKDHLINSRQELYIAENGREDSEMVMENRYGLMEQSI
jgi:hypothetical protein